MSKFGFWGPNSKNEIALVTWPQKPYCDIFIDICGEAKRLFRGVKCDNSFNS
jgi:hypothetical protein